MAFGNYLHCPVCVAGREKHGWEDPEDPNAKAEGRSVWPGYKLMYIGELDEPEGMVCFCVKHAPPNLDITGLWLDHARWSQEQFGADSDRGPLGPIRHLKKEAKELEASPHDLLEYADAFLLVLDASRRAGFDLEELVTAAREKLKINKARTWPKGAADQPVEHHR